MQHGRRESGVTINVLAGHCPRFLAGSTIYLLASHTGTMVLGKMCVTVCMNERVVGHDRW